MTDTKVSQTVEITLLNRTYTLKCSSEELTGLYAAAEHVERTLQILKQKSSVSLSHERLAILAALQIAYEFLELQTQKSLAPSVNQERAQDLIHKMRAVLEESNS